MATQIDSLQISIQSSSTSAAQGIRDLAGALGELRTNGNIGTAVKNLNSLKTALAGISSANLDRLGSQVAKITAATDMLGNIKTGGLGTLVNSLGRLSKVTDSLSDDAISKFADRVKKLNDALTPLSQKMTTLQGGFRGLNSAMRSASSGASSVGRGINAATLNFHTFTQSVMTAVKALMAVVRAMAGVIDEAIQWDGISARFSRGFGAYAQETYAWVSRLNEELGINTQQFMQHSSVYATMLTGFGVAQDDAAKMALGYTELTYDIWAGYNDIYRTHEEAANAVRSAIAGEVEPIRKAGFTIVESTLEQTAANYGLEGSIEKMSEAQKSYLRYLTLVDQAHAQNLVGTYAREMNTAEGMMRTFTQQTKSLAQAFGSLFLPALVKVMPYVQAFVELLTDAVRAVASFFGVDIQPIDWSGYGSGMGSAADTTGDLTDANNGLADSANKAAQATEDLKRATIGIDELNVISPPKEKSGSGAGGSGSGVGGAGWEGLDVDSLWDESIFDGIQNKVDEIKEKIKGLLPVVGGIAAVFGGWKLAKLLDDIDEAGVKLGKFKGILSTISKALIIGGISIAVGKLVWDFTGAYLEDGNLKDLAKAIGTTVLGAAVAGWLTGEGGAGFAILTSGVTKLTRLGIELQEGSVEITDPQALATAVVGALETVLGGALVIDAIRGGVWIKTVGKAIGDGLGLAGSTVSLPSLATQLGGKIFAALGNVKAILAGLGVGGWVVAAIAAVIGLALVDFDFTDIGYKIGHAIGSAFKLLGNILGAAGDVMAAVGGALWDLLCAAVDWVSALPWDEPIWKTVCAIITGLVNGLWNGFANLVTNIIEFAVGLGQGFRDALGIHSPSTVFAEIGTFLIEGLWLGILGMFETLITNVSGFVTDIITKVKEFFGIGAGESEFFKIGKDIVNGLIDGIKHMASYLWEFLTGWVGDMIGWVKKLLGINSPSREFMEIAEYCVAGLQQPFTEDVLRDPLKRVWSGAENWWNSHANLSAPTVKLDAAYGKISAPNVEENGYIWAGTHGAEVLYSMHGDGAEADRMQEAVYEGVYAAVMAAQRAADTGKEQAVNVYLDGKQLSSAIDKRKKERGNALMGTQVYSY